MFHKKILLLFLFVFVASCNGHNIVMFLTDDQDVVLGGMNPMKSVQRFIADAGVTFTNSYTASPICCPSRASILTGLYPHNHLTHGNSIQTGCYSEHWQTHENNTFANILHDAGYSTFYAGKYLNQYGSKKSGGPERVPPGWTEWHGLVGNSVYYNYTLSNNGVPTFSDDLYLTDVIRNLAISYIENQTGSQPFLMVLAPPAPHQPFTPAPRHKGFFSNVTAMRNPSFNVEGTDKHWLIRMPPSPLPQSMMPELDRVYRDRWETLLAVDEMVADVINTLETSNMLADTYLIYTSDNGYHIGQFSQVYDKRQPYETDIKIPLVVSGPGIKPNTTNQTPVINIDLAPTIISLAGLKPPSFMDGKALDLHLQNGSVKQRNLLIEYYGEGNTGTVDAECPWKYDGGNLAECYPQYECKCQDSINNTYACLRHFDTNIDMKYCLFSDKQQFTEIYNLTEDRHELSNIINEVFPAVREHYNILLRDLLLCAGANCNVGKEL